MSATELETLMERAHSDEELETKLHAVTNEEEFIALAEEHGLPYTAALIEEFFRRRIADDAR